MCFQDGGPLKSLVSWNKTAESPAEWYLWPGGMALSEKCSSDFQKIFGSVQIWKNLQNSVAIIDIYIYIYRLDIYSFFLESEPSNISNRFKLHSRKRRISFSFLSNLFELQSQSPIYICSWLGPWRGARRFGAWCCPPRHGWARPTAG